MYVKEKGMRAQESRMRMYVKRKEFEEIAGGQGRSEERRGAEGTSPDVHGF
jgi:hypothetical protein